MGRTRNGRFGWLRFIANQLVKSYLGLLCLGKNDFEAIEGQRKSY